MRRFPRPVNSASVRGADSALLLAALDAEMEVERRLVCASPGTPMRDERDLRARTSAGVGVAKHMPYTPYHLGPGLLFKAVGPRQVSLVAFGATQIAIDLETLYYLTSGQFPIHRGLHTVILGSGLGLACGTVVWLVRLVVEKSCGPLVRAYTGATLAPVGLASEGLLMPSVVGGLLGGLSHSLLDALMHADVSPIWPLTSSNPLSGLMSAGSVMDICVVSATVGAVLWGLKRRAWRRG